MIILFFTKETKTVEVRYGLSSMYRNGAPEHKFEKVTNVYPNGRVFELYGYASDSDEITNTKSVLSYFPIEQTIVINQ